MDPLDTDYIWTCGDCPMSKNHGAARLDRDMAAVRHMRRFPDHTVRLRKIVTENTLWPHANQDPLDLDEIPF